MEGESQRPATPRPRTPEKSQRSNPFLAPRSNLSAPPTSLLQSQSIHNISQESIPSFSFSSIENHADSPHKDTDTTAPLDNKEKWTSMSIKLPHQHGGKRESSGQHMIPQDENIRNRKMEAADCLLFAATLMEEVKTPQKKAPCKTADVEAPSPRTLASVAATGSSTKSVGANKAITSPNDLDVLCGRGGLVNRHPGNLVFRKVVDYNKEFYHQLPKRKRIVVSKSIVETILNNGGRFLILGSSGNEYIQLDRKHALQKTSQALRERSSSSNMKLK